MPLARMVRVVPFFAGHPRGAGLSALGYAAGGTGIWLSVPIGWALADAIGIGYYLKTKTA